MKDIVSLSVERYEELRDDQLLLDALRVYGVNKWGRYQDAFELFNDWVKESINEQ